MALEFAAVARVGSALADALLQAWLEDTSSAPRVVEGSAADRCGGFVLNLSGSHALEVFPNAGSRRPEADEMWRLLSIADDWHFVVGTDGVEPSRHG